MFVSVNCCTTFSSICRQNSQFDFLILLGATAIDALSSGYRTVLIDDCCRGVDLQDIETTKESILSDHGIIVQSHEVNTQITNYHNWNLNFTPSVFLSYSSTTKKIFLRAFGNDSQQNVGGVATKHLLLFFLIHFCCRVLF
jgi:hypothetical protein